MSEWSKFTSERGRVSFSKKIDLLYLTCELKRFESGRRDWIWEINMEYSTDEYDTYDALFKYTDQISFDDIECAQKWADNELRKFFQKITDQI